MTSFLGSLIPSWGASVDSAVARSSQIAADEEEENERREMEAKVKQLECVLNEAKKVEWNAQAEFTGVQGQASKVLQRIDELTASGAPPGEADAQLLHVQTLLLSARAVLKEAQQAVAEAKRQYDAEKQRAEQAQADRELAKLCLQGPSDGPTPALPAGPEGDAVINRASELAINNALTVHKILHPDEAVDHAVRAERLRLEGEVKDEREHHFQMLAAERSELAAANARANQLEHTVTHQKGLLAAVKQEGVKQAEAAAQRLQQAEEEARRWQKEAAAKDAAVAALQAHVSEARHQASSAADHAQSTSAHISRAAADAARESRYQKEVTADLVLAIDDLKEELRAQAERHARSLEQELQKQEQQREEHAAALGHEAQLQADLRARLAEAEAGAAAAERLRGDLSTATADMEALAAQHAAVQDRAAQLQDKWDRLSKEHIELQRAHQDLQASSKAEAERTLQLLEQTQAAADEARLQATKQARTSTATEEMLREELRAETARAESAESACGAAQAAAEAAHSQALAEAAAAHAATAQLQAKTVETSEELRSQQQRLDEARGKLAAEGAELEQWRAEAEAAQAQARQATEQELHSRHEAERRMFEMQQEVGAAEGRVEAAAAGHEAEELRLTRLLAERQVNELELRATLGTTCEAQAAELAALKRRLEEDRARLQAEAERNRGKYEALLTDGQRALDASLQAQVDELASNVQRLQEEVHAAREGRAQAEARQGHAEDMLAAVKEASQRASQRAQAQMQHLEEDLRTQLAQQRDLHDQSLLHGLMQAREQAEQMRTETARSAADTAAHTLEQLSQGHQALMVQQEAEHAAEIRRAEAAAAAQAMQETEQAQAAERQRLLEQTAAAQAAQARLQERAEAAERERDAEKRARVDSDDRSKRLQEDIWRLEDAEGRARAALSALQQKAFLHTKDELTERGPELDRLINAATAAGPASGLGGGVLADARTTASGLPLLGTGLAPEQLASTRAVMRMRVAEDRADAAEAQLTEAHAETESLRAEIQRIHRERHEKVRAAEMEAHRLRLALAEHGVYDQTDP